MSAKTAIEWTDATWNPVTGCSRVSAGCDYCYAERLARGRLRNAYLRRPPAFDTQLNRTDPFAVRLWPERLDQPLRWSHPRMVFVNSMSDLFHHDVPEPFVIEIFEIMMKADQHVYQVLTKRPSRATRFWKRNRERFGRSEVPPHIWIGTSVENSAVSHRVEHLRLLPASVRFLSCEPLLGAIDIDLEGIHWVIVGGESGPEHRLMNPLWARSIRDQCGRARVPFFFKQVGGRTPKAGGRLLDGREWNQMPALSNGARLWHRLQGHWEAGRG